MEKAVEIYSSLNLNFKIPLKFIAFFQSLLFSDINKTGDIQKIMNVSDIFRNLFSVAKKTEDIGKFLWIFWCEKNRQKRLRTYGQNLPK